MKDLLRKRLLRAGAGGGGLVIAMAIGAWYEGDGPTVKQPDGTVLYQPYVDKAGKGQPLTVCRGVTGPGVIASKLYTRAECDTLEHARYRDAQAAVRRNITAYDELTRWQQAALIDFAYNLGEPALAGSTLRRRFNAGDIDGGCRELQRWVKGTVNGQLVTLQGLVERRDTAQELCLAWGRS
ncbi:MAG: lysozyme [Hyphomicrobiales bacterium]|nr:MAG: lysozyme [Hyphomicrobiales bacterium]